MGIDIKRMKKEELGWLQYLLGWTKDRLPYGQPCMLNFDSKEIFPAVKGLRLLEKEHIIEGNYKRFATKIRLIDRYFLQATETEMFSCYYT